MASVAVRVLQQCVFEESLSMSEIDRQWRPYHKNCSCALHRQKVETPKACFHNTRISYTKKLWWDKGSLTTTILPHPIKLQAKLLAKQKGIGGHQINTKEIKTSDCSFFFGRNDNVTLLWKVENYYGTSICFKEIPLDQKGIGNKQEHQRSIGVDSALITEGNSGSFHCHRLLPDMYWERS